MKPHYAGRRMPSEKSINFFCGGEWKRSLVRPPARAGAGWEGRPVCRFAARPGSRARPAPPGKDRPICVMIRAGAHFLKDTLAFNPRDGGTVKAPVIYRAYPGEKVIVSGGRRVANWSKGTLHPGRSVAGVP